MALREIHLTDPTFEKPAQPGWFYRLATRYIRDERDVPFVKLALLLTLTNVPAAVLLFVPGVFSWWLAVPYLALYAYQMGPYILMLHNVSHRRFFKAKYSFMNHWVPTFLAPFFGETPESYFAHHVGMHHPENNLPDDTSSTMRYNRASLLGFTVYFLRFFFGIIPELSSYMVKRRRYKLIKRMLAGELACYALYTGLMFVNWQATLVVFIIPFCFTRLMMMAGNWGQHAFIDARDPGNSLLNSITCINSGYNRRCFNDGYHIGHHVRANRHWTDMPGDFERDRESYVKNGSIVFEGIDFFIIWFLLMFKRYDTLAKHFVELNDTPRSHEEIVALLKERTRRIPV